MSKLTPKQQRFVEEYCVDFNGAGAAVRVGYSKKTAKEQASRLLTKANIKEAIKKRLNELAMGPEEALRRLGAMAAGTVGHFLRADEDGQVYVNLGTEEAIENYGLLKKVKQTKTVTRGDNDYEREETRTEFELYDAKSALVDILKIHGKFIDRTSVTSLSVDIDNLSDDQLERLANGESIERVIGSKG